MRGEWAFYQSKFSKERCEYIISTIKSRPAQASVMGVNGERADDQYRRSRIRWVYPGDPELNWLFGDIWSMALQANDDFFDFHLARMGYLQVAEYKASEKGEYKSHQDVFWMNGDPKYHRKLSAIIQLSDPNSYDGGDFEVYGTQQPLPASVIRSQGTAIFFPSFVQHAALPVTMGTRYSVAAWIDGPKWR